METVKEYMTTAVECCTPLDNVYEAAVKMKELDVGVIPIVDNQKLVGIVTDRDLVIKGIAEKHPGSTKITDVMTTEIATILPSDSIDKAIELMSKHQVRRLPVVENEQLIGIVSLGDFSVSEKSDDLAGEALTQISQSPQH
ncbi:CBS domain-containing protein [Bacillus kexueae]|uniref:CBS domain-containing protein n=1 Tax=Aeribacillus kexueae TaxID=2078952 RepID=UPI001FAEEE93|nr:CBS domain-containing protein [Bacillus kexueae]